MCTVQVREGLGGDDGKAPDLSAERHIPLSESWRSLLVYGYTRQNQLLGELSKNRLFTPCRCRLLNSKALLHVVGFQALWETKGEHNLDYIHEHWFDDFSGSLQAPHTAGENVTIFLRIAKFARCDFIYPSICSSALTATESPFPNTNLPCSHAISAGFCYATKQVRLGINLCPKGTKIVCWRAKKSFILRKLPEKSAEF